MRQTLQEMAVRLRQLHSAAIFCHMRPDGDTLGAAMGLKAMLEQCGVRCSVVCESAIPQKFFFLPGMDGMELLNELRKYNDETKVLILSARGQIADKVEGLDAGANDYMEKPFHLQELEARIRSLTRRKFVQNDICLKCGEIKFDTIKREAYAKEEPVPLTRKENGILEYLLINIGRPVSQEELIEHVWDATADSFSGAIRVHMSSLRKKLKAKLGYDPIQNKVGEGYKIREESDR